MKTLQKWAFRVVRDPTFLALILALGVLNDGDWAALAWAGAAFVGYMNLLYFISRIWHDLNMDPDVILESIRKMGEF